MTGRPWVAAGVGLILLSALPGRAGQAPGTLLLWHAVLVLLLLAALALGGGGDRRIARAPAAAFAAYVGVAAVGAILAPYGYAAFVLLVELGAFAAVAWLSARGGTSTLALLLPALAVAGVWETGLAAWQRFAASTPRPAGSFENPNHLAGWLVAVALLLAGPLAHERGPVAVVAARLGGAVVLLVGVVLTGSRGAVLGLALAGAYLVWINRRRLSRRAWLVAAVFVVLLAVPLSMRQADRLREPDPYRYQRARIWKASLGAVAESPWTGTGPRQFAPAARNLNFPDGVGPLRFDRSFSRTHSDLLRVPCELGIPGLVLMGLAVGLAWRHLFRARRQGTLDATAYGGVAALLALGAQALVDNPSERPAVYLLSATILGAVLSEPRASGSTRQPWPLPGAARGALALALVTLFAAGDVGPWLAWRAASGVGPASDHAEVSRRLDAAVRWNPAHPEYRRLVSETTALARPLDLDRYAAAREAAEAAIRLQPADSRYRAWLAQLEALAYRTLLRDASSRERAAQRFIEAEKWSTHDPFLPAERARLLLDGGDPAGARRAAERVLSIEPASVAGRLLLADALLDAGGSSAAERAAELLAEARETAAKLDPGPGAGPYERGMLTLDLAATRRIETKLGAAAEHGQ